MWNAPVLPDGSDREEAVVRRNSLDHVLSGCRREIKTVNYTGTEISLKFSTAENAENTKNQVV